MTTRGRSGRRAGRSRAPRCRERHAGRARGRVRATAIRAQPEPQGMPLRPALDQAATAKSRSRCWRRRSARRRHRQPAVDAGLRPMKERLPRGGASKGPVQGSRWTLRRARGRGRSSELSGTVRTVPADAGGKHAGRGRPASADQGTASLPRRSPAAQSLVAGRASATPVSPSQEGPQWHPPW